MRYDDGFDDPYAASECQKCHQQALMVNRLSFALIAIIVGAICLMIAANP